MENIWRDVCRISRSIRVRKGIRAHKRKWNKLTACMMAVFFAFLAAGLSTRADADMDTGAAVIRVGYPIQEKLTEVDEDGRYFGYTYDYLMEIAKYTGWQYEFVQVEGAVNEQLTTLLTMLEKGEIDLLGAMNYNDTLAKIYDFPGSNYGMSYYTLCVGGNSTGLTGSNFYLQEQLKVGVVSSQHKDNELLNQFCNMSGVSVRQIFFEESEQMLKALDKGTIDAVLMKDISASTENLEVLARFAPQPFYFAATKGNKQLVNRLDEALYGIEQNTPHFMGDLWNNYFAEEKQDIIFTDEEIAYIQEHPVIGAAAFGGEPPIQSVARDGSYRGLSLDVLSYIEEVTGLRFELTMTESFEEYEKLVKAEQTQVLVGVNDEMQQYDWQYMVTTTPYMKAPLSFILGKETDLEQLRGSRLALQRGILYNGEYNGERTYYETAMDCMEAVKDGSADYCYMNAYSVQYFMNAMNTSELVVVPRNEKWSQHFCLGVKDSKDVHLINILNKAIRSLNQTDEVQIYLYRNAYRPEDMTFLELLCRNPLQSLGMLLLLLMVFLVVVLLIIYKAERRNLRMHRAENERYELLSSISNEYVFNYVADKDSMELSEKCAEYLKLPRHISSLSQWKGEGSKVLRLLLESRQQNMECQLQLPGQEVRWVRIISKWVKDDNAKPLYLVGKLVDIQEEREERVKLKNKAEHDGLTGVYNMTAFRERVNEMYRTLSAEYYVFFIMDIDFFKQINDTYGHFVGDRVLEGIGSLLQETFDAPEGVAGRLGGDEFVMQTVYRGGYEDMADNCRRLCDRIREMSFEGSKKPVTVSIGATIIPRGYDFEKGYKQADAVLYQVKKAGRNGYRIETGEEEM